MLKRSKKSKESSSKAPESGQPNQINVAKGLLKSSLRIASISAQALPTQIPKAVLETILEVVDGMEVRQNEK